MLAAIVWNSGMCHHAQFLSVEMESHKLFCLHWPENMIKLHSLEWQVHNHTPRYWMQWHLTNFMLGLDSNCNHPDFSLSSRYDCVLETILCFCSWPDLHYGYHVAWITGTHHHAQLLFWDLNLINFSPNLSLTWDLPYLCLLNTWDYRCEPLHLATGYI
jgi:hypothetical protein